MKKFPLLVVALYATGTLTAAKTELILRDHQHRAAAFTTFHELHSTKKDFGTKVEVMGFYHETVNEDDLGKVFGVRGNTIKVGTAAQVAAGTADVENNLLLHNHSQNQNTLAGTIQFQPKQSSYGTHIRTKVALDKLFKGLYLKSDITALSVKNDLHTTFCDNTSGAVSTETHWLADVLGGERLDRNFGGAPANRYSEQEPLQYAKLRCSGDSRDGLENVETTLGWLFLKKKKYHVGISATLHTPTGDRPTGEYLWEPRLGSLHWGVGAGTNAWASLWSSKKQSLELFFDFNYRYQFEADEKRTLGIPEISGCGLSHYYLLGKVGHYTLFPAANVTTMNVEVNPGSQIDTFLAINYNCGKFAFDLGYNLFWKEREQVHTLECGWQNNVYGVAAFDFQTCNNAFSLANTQPLNTPINCNDLRTCNAETPDMVSHSIFGSIGYIFHLWERESMVAIGGSYECGDEYHSADSFMLWVKGGIAF